MGMFLSFIHLELHAAIGHECGNNYIFALGIGCMTLINKLHTQILYIIRRVGRKVFQLMAGSPFAQKWEFHIKVERGQKIVNFENRVPPAPFNLS